MKPPRTWSDRLKPLLKLGRPRATPEKGLVKPSAAESALNLTADDAPELLAMATDKQLSSAGEPACYAPIYAWRAIARLRYTPAIRPLIDALDWFAKRDDDWALEELPHVFARLAPDSLIELKRLLPDQRRDQWARTAAATALAHIANADPAHRAAVIDALVGQLRLARYNDPWFNACVVASLLDMRAAEAADAIRRVYEDGDADESLCGDIETVLRELRGGAAEPSSAP